MVNLIETLTQIINLEFPEMENLRIIDSGGKILTISFNEGPYTKEEVELKLKEINDLTVADSLKDTEIMSSFFNKKLSVYLP